MVGSLGVLGAAFAIAPLRNVLQLAVPSLPSWGLIGGATLLAAVLSRLPITRIANPDSKIALPRLELPARAMQA
jgi:hypothetical protein